MPTGENVARPAQMCNVITVNVAYSHNSQSQTVKDEAPYVSHQKPQTNRVSLYLLL